MPKVEFRLQAPGRAIALGEFDVPFVPREGEWVTPFEGWSPAIVMHRDLDLGPPAKAIVVLRDSTGEFSEEAERRAAQEAPNA